jgi:hypothetical protein
MGVTHSHELRKQYKETSIKLMDKEIVEEFYESEDRKDVIDRDFYWLRKIPGALPEYWNCVNGGVKHEFRNDPRLFSRGDCGGEADCVPGQYGIDYYLACCYETSALEYRYHKKCLEKTIGSKLILG